MKAIALIAVSLVTFIQCVGQSFLTINGKLLDQQSKSPLPYATITVKNSSIGTVSNSSGEFEFIIPIDLQNDTLMISFIGYKTFKDRVSHLAESNVFYLEEFPTLLNEVTVSSDGARKLVEEALKAIPDVYPTTPYLMEGFHRSWEKVDFTDSISYPGTLIEAALTIYDPGYAQKKSGKRDDEEVYINELRRSAINKGWNYSQSAMTNLLRGNLLKYNRGPAWNFLKSFLAFPNDLDYEWEGDTQIDDESLSVIKVTVPNDRKFPAYFRVYISSQDHAILRFDLFGEKKEIDYTVGPWHTESLLETYVFKRFRQKPYLSYVKIEYTIKNLDLANKKVLRTEDYFRELLINNLITEGVEEKQKSLSAQKSDKASLALQANEYNEVFWKTYNVILENPLNDEVRLYFEQK